MNKKIGREKPTKRASYSVQGMAKTKFGSSVNVKSLTLSSKTKYALYTDCGMYQADITKIIGIYNHST